MLDRAIRGSYRYWGWIIFLLAVVGTGFFCYTVQWKEGLIVTGMGRDVAWGLYIGQLTYFAGVAAGSVIIILPCYLYDYRAFGRIAVLSEFLAVGAIIMCGFFVMVDLGNLPRMANVLLFFNPKSILFYDMIVLNLFMLMNLITGWNVLSSEEKGVESQRWVRILGYITILLAFTIRAVTAFLYSGIPGRHYWLTALMAPRLLASALASGPAILILLCVIIRRFTRFDPGKEQMQTLGGVIAYAMVINVFFMLLELFTSFYSQIPALMHPFVYLLGHGSLAPFMWMAVFSSLFSIIILVIPSFRRKEKLLIAACILVIISTWIDKGLGLVIGGLNPNPFDRVVEYIPSAVEIGISAGILAVGALVVTILYKIAISVKEEVNGG